ncbi:MAG: PucR family transcriptional regulator [Microbacteriaceae bacterium]|nr:PucR family transcriptional regulator [Microbacteriaceae bacterium]
MVLTIADLARDPELGLRLRTGQGTALQRRPNWAAVSEMVDPSPFLTGGELVCTTGMRLRSVRSIRTFLDAVARAGSTGVAFGVGFTHQEIPEALLDEARRRDLAVLEVPSELSFSVIARRIADDRASMQFERLESQHRRRQRLIELLLGDGGLDAMLAWLGREAGAHVALSYNGELVSGTLDLDDDRVQGWDALPIAVGSTGQATLHVSLPHRDEALIATARSLVGLHLAQSARRIREQREQTGQLLADLVGGRLPADVVANRLEWLGLDPRARYRMLVIEPSGSRRGDLGALPLPSYFYGTSAGLLESRLVVLLPGSEPAPAAAERLLAALRAAGIRARVGIGGAYPVSVSLRWSWFEARDALERLAEGEEIGEASRLSLSALILQAADAPVAELAEEVLGGLERSDAEQGTALIATLDAYLAHSGAIGDIAAELGTHRNTVRYRLEQIAKLSGYDPRILADAVQLSLARTARRVTAK